MRKPPSRGETARRAGAVVLLLAAVLAATSPAAAAAPPGVGAPGVGDPYYPTYGNGGYDVRHYRLDLRYDPASDRLEGRARIEARATEHLARFNLDLLGLDVERITIHQGGHRRPATWTRAGSELVVTPERPLRRSARFMVAVRYGGVPSTVGAALGGSGFFHTDDGAIVVGEPEVAATWFPVNDHPIDKATYAFRITVPDGVGVVANGLPVERERAAPGWTTHVWRARDAMASYLATVAIGRWDVRTRTGPHGLPIIDAVDPDLGGVADAVLAQQGEMITFLEGFFGRYPFEAAGAIVDDQQPQFFSLENQTRPVYSPATFSFPDADAIVVHELAHQWVGNDVTIARWSDIWLNEGFATYAEWLWHEHRGRGRVANIAGSLHAAIPPDDPFWQVVVGDPGVTDLFATPVYLRGGLTVHALRQAVGDRDFFEILRRWVSQRSGGHGTTDQFIALSERVSGRQLDALFEQWLFTPGRPALPGA